MIKKCLFLQMIIIMILLLKINICFSTKTFKNSIRNYDIASVIKKYNITTLQNENNNYNHSNSDSDKHENK